MITACWHDPWERPEKHGGQNFSIKHHQQRNNRLRYKQELVTTYQDPLQLHEQKINILHQDDKHGIIERGICIWWRSILTILQLMRHCVLLLVVISDGSPMNGCQWVNILGHLGVYIYTLGVHWGVLHLALHEILLGREANLVFQIHSPSLPAPYLPCFDSK
jgi:hypothetical protein